MFVSILQHTGLVLLYLFVFALDLIVLAGVPGTWAGLAVIVIYDAFTKFTAVGWPWLLLMVAMAGIGEVIEALLGSVVIARRGATRWGVLGAFVGGIAGAIIGTGVVPVVGSVIFGLVGAFSGAVAGEYIYLNNIRQAIDMGFWAFIGKLQALLVKFALGLGVLAIFIYMTWPR